jgi:hypothetical protein
MTVWRMRIACWLIKATNTVRMCNTYSLPTATMVTVYYIACLVLFPIRKDSDRKDPKT